MAASGKKDNRARNIRKAVKDIVLKRREAAGTVKDAVRGESAAVHDSARITGITGKGM